MQFKSPYNGKEFSIPDEKLPDAPRFAMKCPFTGKKMVFERGEQGFSVTAAETVAPGPAPRPAPPEPVKPALNLPQVEPEVFAPGSKVAFLFLADGAWAEGARSFFAGKGYEVSGASDELEAIAKLRLGEYHVLVAQDGEGAANLLDEVAGWPGGKRRSVNFLLVGGDAPSNDQQAAFVKGVNAYLALADGPRAGDLLEGALRGYDLYYQLMNMAANREQG
ncbi:hypothetical protein [Desulfocurvus sp. DL9XJH121]